MLIVLLLSLSWRRMRLCSIAAQVQPLSGTACVIVVMVRSCLYVVVGDIDLIWIIHYPCDIDLSLIIHCVNTMSMSRIITLDHILVFVLFYKPQKEGSQVLIKTPPSSSHLDYCSTPDGFQTCVNEVCWLSRSSHPGNLNTINTIDCNVGSLQLGAGNLPKNVDPNLQWS